MTSDRGAPESDGGELLWSPKAHPPRLAACPISPPRPKGSRHPVQRWDTGHPPPGQLALSSQGKFKHSLGQEPNITPSLPSGPRWLRGGSWQPWGARRPRLNGRWPGQGVGGPEQTGPPPSQGLLPAHSTRPRHPARGAVPANQAGGHGVPTHGGRMVATHGGCGGATHGGYGVVTHGGRGVPTQGWGLLLGHRRRIASPQPHQGPVQLPGLSNKRLIS